MIGAQIEEGRGKRTGRRVLATQPSIKVEASAEETMTLLGVEGTSIITYTASIKHDGSIDGEGEGIFVSQGATVTWKGIGVGRLQENGSILYTGSLSFNTTSEKLAKLNQLSGVFEWEIDAQGNTHSKMWEFVAASASRSTTA